MQFSTTNKNFIESQLNTKEENVGPKIGEDKLQITFEPSEFPSIVETCVTTNEDLARKVNALFVQLTPQCVGTKIEMGTDPCYPTNKAIFANVFFSDDIPDMEKDKYRDENTGMLKVIAPVLDEDKSGKALSDTMAKIKHYNTKNQQVTHKLSRLKFTESGMDVLKRFVSDRYINKNGTIDWKSITSEGQHNIGNNSYYAASIALDLKKIMFALYGQTNKNNYGYDYLIMAGNPAPSQIITLVITLDIIIQCL